jgi:DNA polymerase-3 subunit beta
VKFTVNTREFTEGLSKVIKVTGKNKQFPAIENVKVELKDNMCYLSATNLTQFVKIQINAETYNNTSSFVFTNSQNIFKAMKYFTNDIIDFDVDNNKVIIKCGGKKADQNIFNADVFPEFPKTIINKTYNYNIKKLKERFDLIKYAISENESRPVLCGIHFMDNRMVACDTYRLALNRDENLTIDKPFTIPAEAFKYIIDIFNGIIDIGMCDKHIQLIDQDTIFISKLLEGDYVSVDSVIPKSLKYNVKADIIDFKNAIQYLKTFINSKEKCPVAWQNNKVMIITANGETYESDVNIDGKFDFQIGFNVDFMITALSQFKDNKEIEIGLNGNVSSFVLSDGNNLALISPMRLSEKHINAAS